MIIEHQPPFFFLVAENLKGQYQPRLGIEFKSSVKNQQIHNPKEAKFNQLKGITIRNFEYKCFLSLGENSVHSFYILNIPLQ